jgi:hypothetical protein
VSRQGEAPWQLRALTVESMESMVSAVDLFSDVTRPAGLAALERLFAGDEVQIPLSFLLDEDGRVLQLFGGWSEASRKGIHRLLEPPRAAGE